MQRREFLKNALGAGLAVAAVESVMGLEPESTGLSRPQTQGFSDDAAPGKLRGVNLGAWLVLEKWMVPSVYEGVHAGDEYGLCLALGDEAKTRLDHHRETFITADDFRWIRECGLNAVRLPVGYWALQAPKPYVECSRFIEFALDQSQKNGLKLLLDLHGAPGSQNGWDHSGRSGPINWDKDPKNIEQTLDVLDGLAQAYGKHPALFGIELLNEPNQKIPLNILQQFYLDAYARLRQRVDPDVAIVFHDSFRPFDWKSFMQGPGFVNVILDTHLYQCFGAKDKARTAREQLQFSINRQSALDQMQSEELPTLVGEWSLALPPQAVRGLSPLQVNSAIRAYGDTQLLNYEGTHGWFFWSYKMERPNEWCFRHCVERGWLQGSFVV